MDSRFARVKNDPRFRRLKRQKKDVVVDKRFKSVLKSRSKPQINKYGQAVASGSEQLSNFYGLDDKKPDYARGEALMESSDEEDDEPFPSILGQDDEESTDEDEEVVLGDPDEINLDEDHLAHLEAQAQEYSAKHPESSHPVGERTRRIAVVNMDWDHVRASHLYKVFSSLLSPTALPLSQSDSSSPKKGRKVVQGSVLDVTIYPSDFGKERMMKEEKEGPPSHIFERAKSGQKEIDGESVYDVGGEEEVNQDALRLYQLERLRYYYAIVSCSGVEAASHCYSELDGTEFERSANVFDLSFVPDDVSFDQEPRDKASSDSDNYRPLDFSTDALRHSKVKLTWDEDDTERTHITKRALSKLDIEKNDFAAYIASETESEPEAEDASGLASRDKLRALLLSGNDENMPEGWNDGAMDNNDDELGDIDMQVTFSTGLNGSHVNPEEETTLDAYRRKMREKRKQRKEQSSTKTAPAPVSSAAGDDFFGSEGSGSDSESGGSHTKGSSRRRRSSPTWSSSKPKDRSVATEEELSRLISGGLAEDPKHFNLSSIMKAEKGTKKKAKGRKGKHRSDGANQLDETQDDFTINVSDSRFTALHEDHDFAIDPTNPNFKQTKAMTALLEERTKRHSNKRPRLEDTESPSFSTAKTTALDHQDDLRTLVDKVKRRKTLPDKGPSKRKRHRQQV